MSDRTPNCGYCSVREETTLGHNPAIGLCKLRGWDLVAASTATPASQLLSCWGAQSGLSRTGQTSGLPQLFS